MRSAVAALVLLLCSGLPSWGQDGGLERIRLTWENDLLAGSDGHYTNGAAIALSGRLRRSALPAAFDIDDSEWELTLAQQLYTPEDTSARALVREDRPYAGFTFLRFGTTRRSRALSLQDRITLTLGIVGPTSGGEAAHRLAHDVVHAKPANGWTHQLRDEPTLGLSYALSRRLVRARVAGIDADVTAEAVVALGNATTHAEASATLRLGLGVPDEYADATPAPFRCYLTASARARAVAYDIFLDGNLLRSGGHRVERRPLVAELSAGLTVVLSDRVTFTYLHTYRTPQFSGQRQGDQFGSLSLVFAW